MTAISPYSTPSYVPAQTQTNTSAPQGRPVDSDGDTDKSASPPPTGPNGRLLNLTA